MSTHPIRYLDPVVSAHEPEDARGGGKKEEALAATRLGRATHASLAFCVKHVVATAPAMSGLGLSVQCLLLFCALGLEASVLSKYVLSKTREISQARSSYYKLGYY